MPPRRPGEPRASAAGSALFPRERAAEARATAAGSSSTSGTLEVVNSTFTACTAAGGVSGGNGSGAGMGLGGAISQRNGSVSIVFSTLDKNTADLGGALSSRLGRRATAGNATLAEHRGSCTLTVDSSILSNSVTAADASSSDT